MKHFMRCRREQSLVRARLFKCTRRNLNDGGVEMFSPSAKAQAHMNHENVSRVGKPSKQLGFISNDGLEIFRQFSTVHLRRAPKHDVVWNAVDIKMENVM